jgi:hypothetical protein
MSQNLQLGFEALELLKLAVRTTIQQHTYCIWAANGQDCGCSAVARACSQLQDFMLKVTASAPCAGPGSAGSTRSVTNTKPMTFEISKSLASAAAAVISRQHHCQVLEMVTNTFQL